MKLRLLGLLVLCAVVVFPSGTTSQAPDKSAGQFIPVWAVKYYFDTAETTVEIGDDCHFSLDVTRFFVIDQQIVVRDQNDEIIALQDLEGKVTQREGGSLECVGEFQVQVPQAKFYTVYLGDERIVGFTATDFPIPNDEAVWITFRQ